MNATITLREYLEKKKCFIIPDYQRGYVWGKNKPGEAKDAATHMMNSLVNGFKTKTKIFIQGVTVSESDKEIVLIDGQQRTTFFYLLLKYLNFSGEFNIRYEIRKESNDFIKISNLLDHIGEDKNEEYQDIYYFKKTLRIIKFVLDNPIEDKDSFREYVLNHVIFLYINVPSDKATKVFTMMNGNKAEMKSEELIKAELLRLASLNQTVKAEVGEKEMSAIEWDNNMLRSRYAREWDKWLQWWNRDMVKKFYKVDNVMGLLVATHMSHPLSRPSFESFRNQNLSQQIPIEAKRTFDKLRRLQKRFEDPFYNPKVYNQIGAIVRILDNDYKEAFIKWYFLEETKPSDKELERYYKLAFLRLTHKEIIDSPSNKDVIEEKFRKLYEELEDNELYMNNPEEAFRLLLRLNIDEDCKQNNGWGRNFDFAIWDRNDSRGRSLEHIYPKSKVRHKEKDSNGDDIFKNGNGDIWNDSITEYIDRESCRYTNNNEEVVASEHSIGNLVLLYKDDNSTFNDSYFEDKKALFFKIPQSDNNKKEKAIFKSRHLLHTIYVFARSEWNDKEIALNKLSILKDFKKYYEKE